MFAFPFLHVVKNSNVQPVCSFILTDTKPFKKKLRSARQEDGLFVQSLVFNK